jgi:uncharacterized MnhB-related membrane protein
MIWQIELVVLLIVLICGIGAIMVKDLLGAAILFGAYSFMMCLLWAIMGAVDVAFTEASVGAGVSTAPQGGRRIENFKNSHCSPVREPTYLFFVGLSAMG